jgi:hypothetical protein
MLRLRISATFSIARPRIPAYMKDLMQFAEKPCGTRVLWVPLVCGLLLAAPDTRLLADTPESPNDTTAAALAAAMEALHPDYARFIGAIRPFAPGPGRNIYMALVRPGATDPAGRDSTPFVGPAARNDIVYDRSRIERGHTLAWRLLLLDHEYFHARHLAGATSLPMPGPVGPEIERRFNEAAAWGFNVGEARAGRYPGLSPDEFREALDRYGGHYAALRTLTSGGGGETWNRFSSLLSVPPALVTTAGARSSTARSRPTAWGRSPATP